MLRVLGGVLLLAAPVAVDAQPAADWTARLAAHPDLADALRLARGRSRLAAGDRAGAVADAEAVYRAAPPWADEAAWLRAQASVDCRDALAWIERAPARPGVVSQPARLALRAASARRCGDAGVAQADEHRLVVSWPWTPQARAVGARVTLSTADRFAQAEAWEGHRDYAQARAVLSELAEGPDGQAARFALARLALDRERSDFPAAAEAYEALAREAGPRQIEAAYEAARAWGRAGQLDRAIAGYRALAEANPSHPKASAARFFAGFLRYEAGRFIEAARAWSADEGRLGDFEGAARWYRAWAQYLAGEPSAVGSLLALADPEGDRAGRRAAYWAIRALSKRAPATAAALAVRLVAHAPLGWYALLLRRRHPGVFPAPLAPPPSPATRPDPAAIRQARRLHQLGLPRLARRALVAAAPALRREGFGPELREAAVALDAPNLAMLDALQRDRAQLARWPESAQAAAAWRAAWPAGFSGPVKDAALGVSPWWIHAFIRKESAYRPDVVSRAHAVGLMQLIEPTARGIAAAGGPVTGDLFDPGDNIRAGGWYVRALAERFRGQLPLVAAAYNGGPRAVVGWAGGRPEAPTDVFVDRIPYREARGYVRRLVEGVVRYRMLHGGESLDEALRDLPLTLDLRTRAGVDF